MLDPPSRAAFVGLACLLLLACGKRGAPRPPEPRGPLPPGLVATRQIGHRAVVDLEVPPARGSKPAQQPVRVELIRIAYAPGVQAQVDPDAFRRRGELVGSMDGDPLATGTLLRLVDEHLGDLADGGVGQTLRYAVRVRDRKRRSSPLVVARDLVLLSDVGRPTALRAEVTADGTRLTWQAPPGDGPFLYNLYRFAPEGREPATPLNPAPVGATEYLDSKLVSGQRYRYAVRVVLAEGQPYREGEPSGTIEVLAQDLFAPATPSGLVAVQEGPAVRLFWNPSAEKDAAGYRVQRRIGDGAWSAIGPDPVQGALYLDVDVRTGQLVSYRVTAVDRAEPPNESEPSVEVFLVVAEEPVAPGDQRP